MTEEPDSCVLTLDRVLDAPRAAIWRCWTDPELLKRWFCPPPVVVARAEIDLRVGGGSVVVMRGPDGNEMPASGVYLEIVPEERLVFTDAFAPGWRPSDAPFMVGSIDLTDEAGGTRYIARARHWSDADRERHEEMGFHEGWGIAASQLETLARSL